MKNSSSALAKEKYFKNVIKSYGIKSHELSLISKDIKPAVKTLIQDGQKGEFQNLISLLFNELYIESKRIGIELFGSIQSKDYKLGVEDLKFIEEEIFDKNLAFDWGTVDTLSSKVIHQIIINNADSVATMKNWSRSVNIWKKRSSCVSFVKLARHGQHSNDILDICNSCLEDDERFVQLGVGWVLREVYLCNGDKAVEFIKANSTRMSREGIRYAVEKMDSQTKKHVLDCTKTKKRKREVVG